MATFVLIHGGGHGGWCWSPVARLLRARGHDVFAPTLSGLADRKHVLTPDTALSTHIADIANLIEYEDLSDVMLVGHSYGGMVITGAADRVIERIGHIVFLDAAIPMNGEALVDVSPGLLTMAGSTRMVDGVELGLWPDVAAGAIYGLNGCEYEDWALSRLTPQPWKTVTEPLILSRPDAVAALPRTIINCATSLKGRPEKLRERWIAAERVFTVDTGHDLMLTEPLQVAEMLNDVAVASGKKRA
ncbi:esterase [Novosphingobium endophyticum]|uniref:Esterase n=1 Tax=Novosphingobium endophyticum TaxID=1955250 RepID=A0A916TNT5_9SPHN|nr:alpha/beta fold hydrolase [Novosphingobium endophyticum]GGB85887.1 esterase [Novosphingobium endophyticum]